MEKIGEKYLPIGTVVMLKGGTKRVMIIGFCAVAKTNVDKLYDYSGCLYPEGLLSSEQVALFDHEQIEEVYHMGLANDEEEQAFKEKLRSITKELKRSASIAGAFAEILSIIPQRGRGRRCCT